MLVRARLDAKDPKKIVIRELPCGTTSEALIASIENAAKRNKIKVASITDYTTDRVEIEIKLARGVHTQDVVDALYAYTDCEDSLSVNLLVIRENTPTIMTVTEVIQYHAASLVRILKAELKLREDGLKDKIHARTLERIFIEERIYKRIEEVKTRRGVIHTVVTGLKPFAKEIRREVTEEDVERLLKIPIRRISLYDINKAREELTLLKDELKQVRRYLKNLVNYALGFLDKVLGEQGKLYPRKTEIISFQQVDVREVAARNFSLGYDEKTGYLGYEVRTGKALFPVSDLDRVLIIRKSGVYTVCKAPDKLFVDRKMWFCGLADKDEMASRTFTLIYRNRKSGYVFIKRCKIEKYILEKSYELIPEGCQIMKLTTKEDLDVVVSYKPKPRIKALEETFPLRNYLVKGVSTVGTRLSNKEIASVKFLKSREKKGR